jgi:hypothetical protein
MDLGCLRGSWAAGDFHLARSKRISFSDVDLICEDEQGFDTKRQIVVRLLRSEGFPLPVSAHREDDLCRVTLGDARVLKIGEYLSKVRPGCGDSRHISYWRAKTVLLLLRSVEGESYQAISERIGTADAQDALAVKLGSKSLFSVVGSSRLIESFGEEMAREFLRYCVISNQKPDYRVEIVRRVHQCKSFSPWLREYILAKMRIRI